MISCAQVLRYRSKPWSLTSASLDSLTMHFPTRRRLLDSSLISMFRRVPQLHHRGLSTSLASDRETQFSFRRFDNGPPVQLGFGKLATLTHSSVVGASGSTVLLTTVAIEDSDEPFLTVEYRQRYHGVGLIPSRRNRKDNTILTTQEILSSRAIDRALRPLLRDEPLHLHVHASVQSCGLWGATGGHPVALALNTASSALADYLTEPVAAVVLSLKPDGSILVNPSPAGIEESYGELLYAGTRKSVVMMEWSSHKLAAGLAEDKWTDLLDIAHACIQPILDTIEEIHQLRMEHSSLPETDFDDEANVRTSLGLPSLDCTSTKVKVADHETRSLLANEAIQYCEERLGESILRLFGYNNEAVSKRQANTVENVCLHRGQNLLSKRSRGKREEIVQSELSRLVQQFLNEKELDSDHILEWLSNKVIDTLMRRALSTAAGKFGVRSDDRGVLGSGWKTIRPIQVQVPALPEPVHGSALFSRGDTKVLCSVTLGPPSDGLPRDDPFSPLKDPREIPPNSQVKSSGFASLPVGSLRFLRSQEAMISDLNSRKIQADREQLGASGSLAEVRRAFLQYDFPAYSKGRVSAGSSAHNRRAIGHGALAERAILPVLPPPHVFPYSIRMACEVTDSNGSSSMGSVCGTTLALLDAGVPITSAVAGISVGLVFTGDSAMDDSHRLLLDITGTEDYYGAMDFKVAGTKEGVTALQLDVKVPVPMKAIVDALDLAHAGRCVLLDEMWARAATLGGLVPRPQLKKSAPRVEIVRFDPQRKRDLIGPGGVVLRQMEDRYGVSMDLTQEGQCLIFGANQEMVAAAKSTVMELVADVTVGQVYKGIVIEIKDFGAILELLRNKEGLLHVSELAVDENDRRNHPEGTLGYVRKHLHVGQEIDVMCIGIDPVEGSIKLSRKAVLKNLAEGLR